MSTHGARFSASSLLSSRMLLLLSGIALAIYIFLKKVSTFNLAVSTDILSLLKAYGLNNKLSSFAISQFLHETEGFTSNVYKSNNNVCGMKYAGQFLSTGEKNGYANYRNIDDSVHDFVNWYTRHRNRILSLPLVITSLSDYVRFLKNNDYFEANEAEYLSGCQYYYNLLFNE